MKLHRMAGIIRSIDFNNHEGKCRFFVRGFLESTSLSITLLATIPMVRAEIIAIVMYRNFSKLGRPLEASIIPVYANGKANILSWNLMASKKSIALRLTSILLNSFKARILAICDLQGL